MQISDKYLFSQDSDLASIKRVLYEKKLSGTSDVISEYESCLARFFESDYAIATSSGTSALQTALFAAGVEAGDHVIVPPTCPSMTILPILYIGAKPVFCDVCKGSLGLDVEALQNKLGDNVKAVIEVPMWGYPTGTDNLSQFLKVKGIPFILDMAQAHGTKLNDKYLSYYADISCFSTHDRKILSTGEGGYILTNNQLYRDRMKSFIQFGNMDGLSFGLNFKLGALQAAIGMSRIPNIINQIDIRRNNATQIISGIKNVNVAEFYIPKGGAPNYYTLLLKLNFKKNTEFIEFLSKEGIPSDILRYDYRVLYEYPLFNNLGGGCKNAENLVKSITTIPVHPEITSEQINYIITKINSFQEKPNGKY